MHHIMKYYEAVKTMQKDMRSVRDIMLSGKNRLQSDLIFVKQHKTKPNTYYIHRKILEEYISIL